MSTIASLPENRRQPEAERIFAEAERHNLLKPWPYTLEEALYDQGMTLVLGSGLEPDEWTVFAGGPLAGEVIVGTSLEGIQYFVEVDHE